MTRKALLIVDLLNDFMPGGALPVPDGDAVIKPTNKIIDQCEDKEDWIIILAVDWHPEDSKHFDKWPIHCVRNTPGAKFHPDLNVPSDAVIIYKGLNPSEDGYSAFDGIAWNGFELNDILNIFSIGEVFVCGVATEVCVKLTAIDAIKKYKTFLLLDACRALTPEGGRKAVKEMEDAGVIIMTTEEVMKIKI
ncbi:MAG: hypothetical protein US76_00630 [Parcubacteria group bacterium GW2011_GWA2_38_13b]|nr:MAG: hypothetical protein US76_00630 [Parcubacteria group bacterium GW2011_GWA2_38_13b]